MSIVTNIMREHTIETSRKGVAPSMIRVTEAEFEAMVEILGDRIIPNAWTQFRGSRLEVVKFERFK